MTAPNKRPGKHAPKLWDRAKALYIRERKTFSFVAKRVGIPEGTIKRRAAKEEWRATREGMDRYRFLVEELKVHAIRKAIKTPSADNINAWAAIERAYPEKTYGGEALKREEAIQVFDSFSIFLSENMQAEPAFMDQLQAFCSAYFEEIQ